jgi:RNA polymerase sigma-32 factor
MDELARTYLRHLDRLPVLPEAEQHRLAVRFAATRDPRLGERLVTTNLRLVITIVRDLAPRHHHLSDLIQEGNLGLMCAVQRFDPGRGTKLSSYAGCWIRAYVLRYLMEQTRAVRVGTREGRRKFFAGGVGGIGRSDLSLDERPRDPTGADRPGSGRSFLEMMSAPEEQRPDVQVEGRQHHWVLGRTVGAFVATLDGRTRKIVQRRLLRETPIPLRQVGRSLGVSGERVRQLEKTALADLRQVVEKAMVA